MAPAIACLRCATPVPPQSWNAAAMTSCPGCGTLIEAAVFPASLSGPAPSEGPGAALIDGEASCFFHSRNRAVRSCDACGRFLCAVCDVDFGGQHLCPTCLEAGKRKKKWRNLEESRVLYGPLALAIAIYPSLFFWPTIVTAPAALYVAIRYWKAPRSIVGGSRLPHIFAILIAVAEMAGWTAFVAFLIVNARSGRVHR